ncbi:MAG: hypothetical protein NTY53_07000 [Kiritimatiellaeota bacterium]|nr:hypothetical protein [Kiritimatiellota bacterium]
MKAWKLFVVLFALAGAVFAGEGRTRESFNADWRFDRFGPMPDGSSRPEPGAAGWAIAVTASSREVERGNPAEYAMDGDPTTRWTLVRRQQGAKTMAESRSLPRTENQPRAGAVGIPREKI